jgi:UDP-glucose 6-dehydrogenase
LYKPFIIDDPSRLLVMDRRSSELTKYGANSMLATRISFMNELSILCEKLGANIDRVRQGIGIDPRIGRKFLYSGPGYGGSCFPKDVSALLKTGEKYEVGLSVLSAVSQANQHQKERMAEKILSYYGNVKGIKLAVWGLAFKPGTDDVREAPAMTIIETACLVQGCIRKDDIFGRYGGEEFVILLPNTDAKTAFELAERIRKAVEGHQFKYESHKIRQTVSSGVSQLNKNITTAKALLDSADKKLYKSKSSGRNKVTI